LENTILFSYTTEYALRATACLAGSPNHTATIPEIAAATQVPAPYLRKVLGLLRTAEIVRSHRGTGGGISLVVDPAKLTVLDVVSAINPLKRIAHCPLGLPEHEQLCPLHGELDRAIALVQQTLAGRTIQDLLVAAPQSPIQCRFPQRD
jgi:Rrf2 family protein